MKSIAKLIFTSLLVLQSAWAYSTCEEESKQLIILLQEQAVGVLPAPQREKAEQLIEQQCEARQKEEQRNRRDYFTDYILSGESGNKPGNDRLKKRSR